MKSLKFWAILLTLGCSTLSGYAQEDHSLEAPFTLYNFPNMPKSVNVFESYSRALNGKVVIEAESIVTCKQTQKSNVNGQPVIKNESKQGIIIEFLISKDYEQVISCSSQPDSPTGYVGLKAKYHFDVIENPEEESRVKKIFNDWLVRVTLAQQVQELDRPPRLCEETVVSPLNALNTGFIYRMARSGEACTTPIIMGNKNVISFCQKSTSDDIAIEAKVLNSKLAPLGQTIIPSLEIDTLSPKILKTSSGKEMVILHNLTGNIVGLTDSGKVAFAIQLPLEGTTVPATYEGKIFAVSQEKIGGIKNKLFILDHTGNILSETVLPGKEFSTPLVDQNGILVGNDQSQIIHLSSDGEILKIIELGESIKYPKATIRHIIKDDKGHLTISTSKGEILKINETEEAKSFFLASNSGKKPHQSDKNLDRDILSAPVILKDGRMIISTDNRLHFIKPDGELEKIVQTGNLFHTQSALSLLKYKDEELLWLGSMGSLYAFDLEGVKRMEFNPFDTHRMESMAENYSSPVVSEDGRILVGVYQGLRWFKLGEKQESKTIETNQSLPCN